MAIKYLDATVAYLVFCAATIALLVFLNASQPFVLSQIYGLQQVGSASGVLALVDEIVSIIMAPLWGALSDKIGTRYCAVAGLWIMAGSIMLYPRSPSLYPVLPLIRALFSLGASACVAMIPAALAELSLIAGETSSSQTSTADYADDFESSQNHVPDSDGDRDGDRTAPLFETAAADEMFDAVVAIPRPNGKLSGAAGFASGIGAVLAVSVLLPLPTTLSKGSSTAADGIKAAYSWVGLGGIVVAIILLATLYQNPARGLRSLLLGSQNVSIFDEAAVDAGGSVMTYLELLTEGFLNARSDSRLQVAYLGSLVARSASVVLALFVPLWVNQWFYDHEKCQISDPNGCRAAITQAAILTGIANSMMLLIAPFAGWAGDRFGSVKVLEWSSLAGFFSMVGFLFTDDVSGFVPIFFSCLIGASQIGVVTMSMSMSTDKRRVAGGSVAGVYSLCGSLGILLITQIGGPLADIYIKTPFLVMAVLFVVLLTYSHRLSTHTARMMRSFLSLH
nr:MFS.7 [Starmerella bombicola]